MNDWTQIIEVQPRKMYGDAYEFLVEYETEKFGKRFFSVIGIWDVNDWYLLNFESISGYEGMSGLKYFETYKPLFWKDFMAPNLAEAN